jgi:hypothetical protein
LDIGEQDNLSLEEICHKGREVALYRDTRRSRLLKSNLALVCDGDCDGRFSHPSIADEQDVRWRCSG